MDMLESGRHPVNVAYLVMGIAFLGLVGVWALIEGDVVEGGEVRWLMPVPWVLAGLAGLLATTVGSRRHATRQVGWVEPAAAPADTDATDETEVPGDAEDAGDAVEAEPRR